jgi:hypothetical protein
MSNGIQRTHEPAGSYWKLAQWISPYRVTHLTISSSKGCASSAGPPTCELATLITPGLEAM